MGKSLKVLLVDDENDFLETTSKRLKRRGYSVKSALNCPEAFNVLENGWADVVVLDVMLPGKDGIQCLREIKEKWPTLTVILLTGHASMQVGLQSLDYGANDYCLKPIELDELVEKIEIAYKDMNG